MPTFTDKSVTLAYTSCDPDKPNVYRCSLSSTAELNGDHIATIDFSYNRTVLSWYLIDNWGNKFTITGVQSFYFTEAGESYQLEAILSTAYASIPEVSRPPLVRMPYVVTAIYAPSWAAGEGEIDPTPDIETTPCGSLRYWYSRSPCCECDTYPVYLVVPHLGCAADASSMSVRIKLHSTGPECTLLDAPGTITDQAMTFYDGTYKLWAKNRCYTGHPPVNLLDGPFWYTTVSALHEVTHVIKNGTVECPITTAPGCYNGAITSVSPATTAPSYEAPYVECGPVENTSGVTFGPTTAGVSGTPSYIRLSDGEFTTPGCGHAGVVNSWAYRAHVFSVCGSVDVYNDVTLPEDGSWTSVSLGWLGGIFVKPYDWYYESFEESITLSRTVSVAWPLTNGSSLTVNYSWSSTLIISKLSGTNDIRIKSGGSTASLTSASWDGTWFDQAACWPMVDKINADNTIETSVKLTCNMYVHVKLTPYLFQLISGNVKPVLGQTISYWVTTKDPSAPLV